MNPNHYIVDVQGFKDKENNFIVKEFALATEEYTHVFLVKPPFPFSRLTDKERRQVLWIEKQYGITWSEGFIDYREFKRIVKPYLENKKIIVKGFEKIKWIKELCSNCSVTDIGEKGCPKFSILYESFCNHKSKFTCANHLKHCALKNVICIKKWYIDNNLMLFSNYVFV